MSEVILLTGDCVEKMQEIEQSSIDMVLTSPPYDSMRQYEGFSIDIKAVIDGIWRVLKKGGVCIWVTGDQMVKGSESGTSFKTALEFMKHGFLLHDTMIYRKSNSRPNIRNDKARYHQSFEYMFCFSKGKPNKFRPLTRSCKRHGEKCSSSYRNRGQDELEHKFYVETKDIAVLDNVFSYATGLGGSTSYKPAFTHPAVFPEKLAYDQIRSWTDAGDTVLDPMCGSGTTVFCAYMLDRNAIGIDVSEKYIELTRQRLKDEQRPKWMEDDA